MIRLAALFALVLVTACSGGLRDPELYGTYVATYANGTQKLTLRQDGTFVQEVRMDGIDSAVINSGTWQHSHPSNRPDLVDLKNCFAVNDGFGRIRADFAARRGGCSLTVERRFLVAGQLRLGPDEGSPLWKVD
jgi:hypothetical protein